MSGLAGLVALGVSGVPGGAAVAAGASAVAAGAAAALVVRPPVETRLQVRLQVRRGRSPGASALTVERPPEESAAAGDSGVSVRTGRSGTPVDGPGTSVGAVLGRFARRRTGAPPGLDDVLTLLDRLAALLRAGLGPRTVWEQLAAAPGACRPVCAFVAESLATGGEPGRAVAGAAGLLPDLGGRRSPRGSGPRDVLRWLAIATTVSSRTGAPAADCVDRLAAAVRAELAAADERAGALAGPRATAQVLAWLPAGGVVLGALVGADPVGTLLLTGPGRLCLLGGSALWAGGLAWSRALVRAAARAGE